MIDIILTIGLVMGVAMVGLVVIGYYSGRLDLRDDKVSFYFHAGLAYILISIAGLMLG